MSVAGVGIDLLEISRMEKSLENERFSVRVFTAEERGYISGRGRMAAASAAGIFCAKEAFIKSVGEPVPLQDICVLHEPGGRPYIRLGGSAAEKYPHLRFHLSITHTDTTAAAVIVADKTE